MEHSEVHGGHAHGHSSPVAHEHPHPSPLTYIKIALILLVITIVEVVVLYIPDTRDGFGLTGFKPFLIPAFLILSATKFVLVVGYYMHLKFDDSFFLRVFGFALFIALSVATAIIALFHGIYIG